MIPQIHYISQGATAQEHLDHIHCACAAGAELVQLRLKNFDAKTVLETAHKAREITIQFLTKLIINDYYQIAAAVDADGVHLGKSDGCPTLAKLELASWQIIGGTANTKEDCQKLIDIDIDYIGLGPYRFTSTKQNLSPVLGKNGLTNIISSLETTVPIIAVGGITPEDARDIVRCGAHGIAISISITRDFKMISKFKELLKSSPL